MQLITRTRGWELEQVSHGPPVRSPKHDIPHRGRPGYASEGRTEALEPNHPRLMTVRPVHVPPTDD